MDRPVLSGEERGAEGVSRVGRTAANPTVPAALRLYGVWKSHLDGEARVDALRGVTADFHAGTFTAVCGPSGSGKSTLLMCAAGLTRPTCGAVELAGQRIERLPERRLSRVRRDHAGFVFQQFNLVDSLTALDNVYVPARLAGRPATRQLAARLLTQVGLADRMRHRPGQLSGGQQQRVAIARALINQPAVLFADEPTGALDVAARDEILGLLRHLATTAGVCVVMVTHDPAAAERADRVLVLVDGVLVEELPAASRAEIARRAATASRAENARRAVTASWAENARRTAAR